jgi:hypothetical protein
MEKDPARRYQDARSLGQALLPFTSDRVALTYRAELDTSAGPALVDTRSVPGKSHPPLAAADAHGDSTLSLAARSVATTVATPAPLAKLVTWATVVALALVGALLAFWPQETETTIQPAAVDAPAWVPPPTAAAPTSAPHPATPPTAAAPAPPSAPGSATPTPTAAAPSTETPLSAAPLPDSAAAIDATKPLPAAPIAKPTNVEKPKSKTAKPLKIPRAQPTAAPPVPSEAPAPQEDVWGNRK